MCVMGMKYVGVQKTHVSFLKQVSLRREANTLETGTRVDLAENMVKALQKGNKKYKV